MGDEIWEMRDGIWEMCVGGWWGWVVGVGLNS